MARLEYADPEAEAAYQKMAKETATKRLSADMKVDAYTQGTMSARAGAEAQSIDEIVRKRR